jgi:hypothetical protein
VKEGDIKIRKADPLDHETIICALLDWWGGRDLTAMLPKLFLNHFSDLNFSCSDRRAATEFKG